MQDSKLSITGGEVVGNTAKSGGGGVMLIKSAATMSGGEIRGNYSEGNYGGGGVFINTSGFKMTGGTISFNSTISNGGGIYQYTATPIGDLVLAGGAITNNTCATGKNGGGVFVSVNLHITGDMIVTNNVAGGTIENGVLSGGTPYNIHLGSVAAKDIKIGYNDGVITSNNFSGKVGIYSNNYEVNKTFGTVIEGAIITGEITNDRNAQLTGYKQGANCAWGNAVAIKRAEKKAEILSYYDGDDYSTINWSLLGSIIDNALAPLSTVEDVHNFEIASLAAELGEVAVWTQEDIDNAGIEVRSALEQYYQDKCSEILGETIPKDIEYIIQAAINSITSKNYDDAAILGDIILNGKIAIAKEVQYFVLDALQAEYNPKLYNTTNWNKLVGYITAAKAAIAGYTNLATIENYNLTTVRTNCNSVATNMVARIGDNYYETVNAAVASVAEGGTETIYIIKSIDVSPSATSTLFLEIKGNRNITLRSDLSTVPQGKTVHVMKRDNNGSFFTINDGCFLTLADIEIDGNNYKTITATNYSQSIFYVNTGGTVTIEDNTLIHKCGSQCGYTVASVSGTFIMNGGSISDNKNNTAIPAINGDGYFYFNGGEIINNQPGSASYGAVNISSAKSINISGGMVITNNKSDTARNLNVGSKPVNATGNFTGYVSVYADNYAVGATFGTVAEGAVITGTINNARNTDLVGVNQGGNLIWDYVYDKSRTAVTTKPTVATKGVVTRYTVDNVARTSEIPMLNTDDYFVEWDNFLGAAPQITYTLKDTFLGNIVIPYNLPSKDDISYDKVVNIAPDATTAGQATITNANYPGFEATIVIPALTSENYTVIYDTEAEIIIYQLKDGTYGDISFDLSDSELEVAKLAKMQDLFAKYEQSNYGSDSWQEIESIISDALEDICWLDDLSELESYTIDSDTKQQLDGILTISSVKDNVTQQLENYYKAQTGLQDIPEAVLDIITQAAASINAENYNDTTIVDSIILDGEIAIAKYIKVAQLQEYNQGLISSHYTTANWNTVQSKINNAISAINAKGNLVDVETYDIQTVIDECDALYLVGFVARVGENYYTTFASAYTAVASGGTIYLISNIVLNPQATTITKSITITSEEGNIYKISSGDYSKQGALLKINNATVTIRNIEMDGGKTLNTTSGATSPARVTTARAIHVENNATLNIQDGTLIHNFHGTSSHGGAIYITGATLIMSGGEISNYTQGGKQTPIPYRLTENP